MSLPKICHKRVYESPINVILQNGTKGFVEVTHPNSSGRVTVFLRWGDGGVQASSFNLSNFLNAAVYLAYKYPKITIVNKF